MLSFLSRYENNKKFTPKEAWKLFKIVANLEAIGWSILISGILVSHYCPALKVYALPIAGQIHGTIFVGYFILLFSLYPSLKWNRTNFLFGAIAGIVPYGSVVFEILMARSKIYLNNVVSVSVLIRQGAKVLAVQPSKGIGWQFPSVELDNKKIARLSLTRTINNWFGVDVSDISIYMTKPLIYKVKLSKIIDASVLLAAKDHIPFIDELALVSKPEAPDLFKLIE